jgi:gamma-glutamyltranspeptidase
VIRDVTYRLSKGGKAFDAETVVATHDLLAVLEVVAKNVGAGKWGLAEERVVEGVAEERAAEGMAVEKALSHIQPCSRRSEQVVYDT